MSKWVPWSPGPSTGDKPPTAARVTVLLLALIVLAAAVTIVIAAIYQVIQVGGFCASGGPYEIGVECPPNTDAAFWGGAAVMLAAAIVASIARPSSWPGVASAWLAVLFVGMTVCFLWSAFVNPDGAFHIWPLIVGVVFLAFCAVAVGVLATSYREIVAQGRTSGLGVQVVAGLVGIALGAFLAVVWLGG